MEIEEKLKLAFKQGMRYKNMWTEKHGYNEKFSFDNWLAENKQLLIQSVSQQRELLKGYEEWLETVDLNTDRITKIGLIDRYLKTFNCG